jgi:hypothetical protein
MLPALIKYVAHLAIIGSDFKYCGRRNGKCTVVIGNNFTYACLILLPPFEVCSKTPVFKRLSPGVSFFCKSMMGIVSLHIFSISEYLKK